MASLADLRALLARPEAWLHKGAARDADGREVAYHHADAVAFCLASAAYRVDLEASEEAALRRLVPGGMLGLWNDWETVDPKAGARRRTHAEVLALIDRAVERVERDRAKRGRREGRAD